MKRFLLLLAIILIALPAAAFVTSSASNVSASSGPPRAVMEPIVHIQQIDGVAHGIAAYVNFPDATNAPLTAQIQVAHTTDFVNWSAPVTLPLTATNGVTYEKSADPVLIEVNHWYYPNWLFCFGTLWKGINNQPGSASTIGAWHSTDGGVTWSAPEPLDTPQPDTVFDDKPAAAVASSNGIIYVPFTRTTTTTTQVWVAMLLPTRGWALTGPVGGDANGNWPNLPGPTPVYDSSTGYMWLFMFDRPAQTIRAFFTGDAWIWHDASSVSAPGIGVGSVTVGNTSVQAVPFLSGGFDPTFRFIWLFYHRTGDDGVVNIVSRRFNPLFWNWTLPEPLNPNGHTQWNPAILMGNLADITITYYDYNSGGRRGGDPGYSVYASHVNLYGITDHSDPIFKVNGSQQVSELSDPASYNTAGGFARIGEYQGLAELNGTFYAATIYIPQSTPRVGNAYVVKFTP
jgi:hypothetical protein